MDHSAEFDEIYRRYAADVYRFLLRLCGSEPLAQDIMQDTMLRAFTDIGKFRGECSMKTWLCTIARNLFLDHCKKAENRNLPLDAMPDIPDGESLVLRLSDQMQALEIHRMLHRLDEPYREVFSLRSLTDVPNPKVRRTNISTVSARICFI